jgi:hypothetical protein
MSDKKIVFAQHVIDIILNLCRLTFNLKEDREVENLFGMDLSQFKHTIDKSVLDLPDAIFSLPAKKLEEIANIFAREFIFFQVQEVNCPKYQEDLSQFFRIFSRDIQRQMPGLAPQMNWKEE